MPPITPKAARERARVASLSRSRAADDPELISSRRELRATMLESLIEQRLAEPPPLSDEQRRHLAALFARGGAE